ncbi:hypothetical protein X566_04550 [Afipia sp. P52-10]|uniref:hypothetical protein n=1 Tax=Afipia sp. P52-10 TaxID=1429916 RepID=UPI0003DF3666|nr:hypothetical protein [Afipia sp. P52-10]ETR78966.1 hypothetical protein X566_04550 [Afipia sp. P52-10]
MAARLGIALHWACVFIAGLAIALVVYIQFANQKLTEFQQLVVWAGYAFAFVVWLLGYGLRFVLAGDVRSRSNHVHEFVERFASEEPRERMPVATSRQRSEARSRPGVASVPAHRDSTSGSRARATAQSILSSIGDREAFAEDERQLYDFLVSAATAVVKDQRTAEIVGAHMVWR